MPAPKLSFREVTRRYEPHVALDGVDLDIPSGQRVALIGPSGSGKSTILALANGVLNVSGGTLTLDGTRLSAMSHGELIAHRKRCGLVPQGGDLVDQLSVHDNVLAGLLPHWPWYRVVASRLGITEKTRVQDWLARVNLKTRQFSKVEELSGGEKQRVAIVRGLIGEPDLILADEATASLDPHIGEQMAEMLFGQAEETGSTLLFATHWVSLARRLATRVVGLRAGKVVLDAPAKAISDDDIESLYAGSDEQH